MRRTRHVVLPVRSWQYVGLMIVSLACLTLGLVSRDREGQAGSLAGPELKHRAPHEMDACPNESPFIRLPTYDDSAPISRQPMVRSKENGNYALRRSLPEIGGSRVSRGTLRTRSLEDFRSRSSRRLSWTATSNRAQWTVISNARRISRDRTDFRTGLESSSSRFVNIHSRDARRTVPNKEVRLTTRNAPDRNSESLTRVRGERENDHVTRLSRYNTIDRDYKAKTSRTIETRVSRSQSVGDREIRSRESFRLTERGVRSPRIIRSPSDLKNDARSLERRDASTSRSSRDARSFDPSVRNRVQERVSSEHRIESREIVNRQARLIERQAFLNSRSLTSVARESRSREDRSRSSRSAESLSRNSRLPLTSVRSVDRGIQEIRQELGSNANRRSVNRDLEGRRVRGTTERRSVSERRVDESRIADRRNVRSIDHQSRTREASRRLVDFDRRESRTDDQNSRSLDRTRTISFATANGRKTRRSLNLRSSRLQNSRKFHTGDSKTTTIRNDRTAEERGWIDSLRNQKTKNVRSIDERRSSGRQIKDTDRSWSYDRRRGVFGTGRSDRETETRTLSIRNSLSRERTVLADLPRVSNERNREERTARRRIDDARSTSLIFEERKGRTTSRRRVVPEERRSNSKATIDGRFSEKIERGRRTGNKSRESLREIMSRTSSKILTQERPWSLSSYEILRQALIIALCTVYGASIYNGKNNPLGNFVRQATRLIDW